MRGILIVVGLVALYAGFLGGRVFFAKPLWKRRRLPLLIRWWSFEREEKKARLERAVRYDGA